MKITWRTIRAGDVILCPGTGRPERVTQNIPHTKGMRLITTTGHRHRRPAGELVERTHKHEGGGRAMPDYAGLRSYTRARSTGTHVGVYDGEPAGMDTAGGRWQTVCEEHGSVISHETLRLARQWASCPEDWCETCMAAGAQ